MKKITMQQYKDRCNDVHRSYYDYSMWEAPCHSHKKVPIICPIHGVFHQRLSTHVSGGGCAKCSVEQRAALVTKSTNDHINDFKNVHGDRYDYSAVPTNIHINDKIPIICKSHGTFVQTASTHKNGSGCQQCAIEAQQERVRKSMDEYITKGEIIHNGVYTYENTNRSMTSSDKVAITCPIHGDFRTTMRLHVHSRSGCPDCGQNRTNQSNRTTLEEKVRKLNLVHDTKYKYPNLTDATNIHDEITIECPTHGEFQQQLATHLQGWGCRQCSASSSRSRLEDEIYDYISSVCDLKIERSNRTLISPKEIDIVIPELNLGIEVCGVYWHSDEFKTRRYHRDKLLRMIERDYRLITIFESDWNLKRSIVKSRLKSIIGKNKVIYARRTQCCELSRDQSNRFIDVNHLQGKRGAKYRYGLMHDGELVAAMTLSSTHEIIRYCTLLEHNVVGGASKLLKYHINKTNPLEITTFADRRWGEGDLYRKMGFTFVSNTPPNYYYFKGNCKLQSRLKFQKHKLHNILEHFDPNKSEYENMKKNGYNRIYDCGSAKFVMKINN